MLKRILKTIESIGVSEAMSLDKIRQIRTMNNLRTVGIVIIFVSTGLAVSAQAYIILTMLAALILSLLMGYYLTAKDYHDVAASTSFIAISAYIFGNAVIVIGDVGLAYLLLALIGAPAITIDLRKKILLGFTMLVPIIFFFLILLLDTSKTGLASETPPFIDLLLYENIVATVVALVSQILFFIKEMDFRYKLYEEEHERLLRQGIMSDLGIMSAGIAHEINNPLTIIKSYTKILKNKVPKIANVPLESDFSDSLHKIDTNVQRIVKIINGIKHLARNSENDDFKPLSIKDLIEGLVDLFSERFKTLDIHLNLMTPDNDVNVLCRGAQLEQALVSLFSNSIDAIKDVSSPEISLIAKIENECVLITVEDNGEGVAPENQELIMKSFFTTKPVGTGTGIGLSIAKRIIEDHSGELTLISLQPAIFQIKLPISQ